MTSRADKNEIKMMMKIWYMIKNDACMSIENIKCRSLILSNEVSKNKQKNREKNKKDGGAHTYHTSDKNSNNYNNRKENESK